MGCTNKSLALYFLCIMVASSCRQNGGTNHPLPITMDDSSRVIIERAIAYAGGKDVWLEKKTLSFDKTSTSYDSAGNVVRKLEQHFDYMMQPEFRAKVTYTLNDTSITLIHDGQKARKLFNGKLSSSQKDIDQAWNASFGSHYVMCMPYKLTDPGIKAEYVGELNLVNGGTAQVIKTSYIKGAGSNPDHIWYYYFEPGTGKLLANSLNGKDNYWDFTHYQEFETVSGLKLPSIRKGYTATGLNKPGRQVSESKHFNIVFDVNLPKDHFKIPNEIER